MPKETDSFLTADEHTRFAESGGNPARPHLDERSSYVPRGKQESFIVPLLAQTIARELPRIVPVACGTNVALDVGCGRQPLRADIEQLGFKYVGLDTQQNVECPVDIVAPIDGPLTPEMAALGPFRFILCTEVFEHVADWNTAFANLSALLVPGGRILMTAPFVYPLHERPYDFWRPTVHAVEFFARRHGLRVVQCAGIGDSWDALGTVAASMTPVPRRSGVIDRLAALTAKICKELVFRLAASRWIRDRVEMRGELYQSTFAVLEKP